MFYCTVYHTISPNIRDGPGLILLTYSSKEEKRHDKGEKGKKNFFSSFFPYKIEEKIFSTPTIITLHIVDFYHPLHRSYHINIFTMGNVSQLFSMFFFMGLTLLT